MRTDIQLVEKTQRDTWCRWLLWTLLLLVCLWGESVASAGEAVGRVDRTTGNVTVERQGKTEAAETGAPVYLNDKLETKANSSVEIVFVDQSRVKMTAGTVLEITEYLYDPGGKKRESLLSMVSGKARFVVADLQDFKQKRFRVQTQTSVVGTRDTDFCVWVISEVFTKTLCLENVVAMFSRNQPGKPILLTANMVSEVYGTNLPAIPRFATKAERREFLTGLEMAGTRDVTSSKDEEEEAGEEDSGGASGTGATGGIMSPLMPTLPPPETLPEVVTPPVVTPVVPTTTRPTTPTTTTTRPRVLPPPPTLPKPPPPPGRGNAFE